jgi:hypothetical protein
MISHKHKFIYIHIPKAGGTTIESTLFQYASDSCGTRWAKENKCYRNKELFNIIEEYSNYYTFTFSRNPYSRIVSLYNFFEFHNSMSFKCFLNKVCEFIDLGTEKIYKERSNNATDLQVNLRKACNYPFNDNGNIGYHILPQSYFVAQKNHINFIGKMEALQQDFDTVCDKTGIPKQQLPHKMKSKHKHYTEYYDDETREIVAEKYAKDIDYFGYKFGD